jgi:hypothetical protein
VTPFKSERSRGRGAATRGGEQGREQRAGEGSDLGLLLRDETDGEGCAGGRTTPAGFGEERDGPLCSAGPRADRRGSGRGERRRERDRERGDGIDL